MKAGSRQLTRSEIEEFGAEVDAIRAGVMADLGQEDVDYIRQIITLCRVSEISGRVLLNSGFNPLCWLGGTTLLALAKILDNMEIGHNIMHGQYDWTHDPALDSKAFEWDNACPSEAWRHSHNFLHHHYANIIGKDRDFGYGSMRLSSDLPWEPKYLLQPAGNVILAVFFQWWVAGHDLGYWREQISTEPERYDAEAAAVRSKLFDQFSRDYIFFPLVAGAAAPLVFAGNATANLARNLWAYAIIFCGHFSENVSTFHEVDVATETRGEWYLRQLKASGNILGNDLFHLLSGHLGFQIEHHLFPDMPSNRLKEIAPKIQQVCVKYGQHYNTGTFFEQFGSVVARIFRFALPDEIGVLIPGGT